MLNFIRPFIWLLAGLLLGTALAPSHDAFAAEESGSSSSSTSRHPDLNYLKAINSVAPPRDPELLFLLMAGYSNANLQGEGAEFFFRRERGRVSQPLMPRVKSVMPLTSTITCVDSVFDS
jgi:hypothetical protein